MRAGRRGQLAVALLLLGGPLVGQPAGASSGVAPRGGLHHVATYRFTDLGVLGGLDSRAHALSRNGYVAGLADTSPGSWVRGFHAFRWTPDHPFAGTGAIEDLGAWGDDRRSAAQAVNARGVTAGVSLGEEGGSTAFVFMDRMRRLPGLGGDVSTAADIDDHGRIVGAAKTADRTDHAVLWVPRHGRRGGYRVVDLGAPVGRVGSSAEAVNQRGQVAGVVSDPDFYGFAALWTPSRPHGTRGTWQELGALAGGTGSVARDLNRFGVVVGQADSADGDRGWVWDGRLQVLEPLAGGWASHAFGVNDRGAVVGYSSDDEGDRAVVFVDGRAYDLNDLLPPAARARGYVLRAAHDVNNRGQIVGVAGIDGHARGFLLTPRGRSPFSRR